MDANVSRLLLGTGMIAGVLSACNPATDLDRVSAADSAGVLVVTSHSPRIVDAPHFIGEPELSIGGVGSELNRVIGAVRLSNGRIAIGDGGNAAIQYFSSEGILLRSVGRVGDGPSEFRTLQAMGRVGGDTVWAYDFTHHRVTIVSPEAEVVREISLRPPLGSGLAVGFLPDGTFVLGESWSSAEVAESTDPGLNRELVAYARYWSTGVMIDTVGLFPGREVLLSFEGGRGVMGAAPMARSAAHSLLGSWLAIGEQVTHEVGLYSAAGRLERIIRWDGADLNVSSDHELAWRRARLASVPSSERAEVRRQLVGQAMPTNRPAYGRILTTEAGALWVAHYALNGEEPAAWTVLSTDGVWQETIVMPPRFRPLEVGLDWVLGVSRDEFDVQRVELRPMDRGD